MRRIFILMIISLLIISGCSGNSNKESQGYSESYMKNPEGLEPSVVFQMRKDFQQLSEHKPKLDTIWVQQYFGNYNGCEVAYMGSISNYNDAHRPVEVAGYTIVFPDGQEVYVHRDSLFYTIKEAFEVELITKQDVYKIGKKVGIDFEKENPGI